MLNHLLNFLIALFLIGIVGCASAPSSPPLVITKIPDKYVPIGTSRTFTFSKKLGVKISQGEAISAVARSFDRDHKLGIIFRDNTKKFGKKKIRAGILTTKIRDKNIMNVTYSSYVKSQGKDYLVRDSVMFNYSVTEDENSIVVKLEPATEISTTNMPQTPLESDLILSRSEFFAYIKKHFLTVEPKIIAKKVFKRELDSQYSKEAVYYSLERELRYVTVGQTSTKTPPSSPFIEGSFKGPTGPSAELKVKVHPYRNGSKLEMEFDIYYGLKADGTSGFKEQYVEDVVAKVKDIIK